MRDLRIDVERIEEQIVARFSFPKGRWSWNIERVLAEHVLIHLHVMTVEPGRILPIVWSSDGTISAWDLDSWDKFTQLVEDEGLSIADNLADILDIFGFFQPYKRVLQSVTDLAKELVSEKDSPLVKYAESIRPPVCLFGEGKQQVKFWAIDYGSGNLEEWLLVQKEAELHVQSWTREERLILTLLGH